MADDVVYGVCGECEAPIKCAVDGRWRHADANATMSPRHRAWPKATGQPPFVTKTTDVNDAFATGSVRGDRTGKGRYDLLPREAVHRLAQLYERGATAYGDRNWELGQPFSRVMDSLLRHAFQAAAGMHDEDHLAAVMWNAAALIAFEERVAAGELPADLDDLGRP